MIKAVFFSAVLVVVISTTSFRTLPPPELEEIEWMDLETAQKMVSVDPRPIFVDVYATWCGPCKLMDKKTFRDPDVVEYVKANYYAVKLDGEEQRDKIEFLGSKKTAYELAHAWRIRGYPTVVLFDPQFETMEIKPGFRNPDQFLSVLQKFEQQLN